VRLPRRESIPFASLNYVYSGSEGSKVDSKSKRTKTGILSCAEKASRFSNEGALIPRSIRLKNLRICQEVRRIALGSIF